LETEITLCFNMLYIIYPSILFYKNKKTQGERSLQQAIAIVGVKRKG